MNAETKIFVSVFAIVFTSAFLGVFMLIPFYYGHALVDLGRLKSWTSSLFSAFLLFLSLVIASISVILYEVYTMIRKRREKRKSE
jgi:hypothetical membrane protein